MSPHLIIHRLRDTFNRDPKRSSLVVALALVMGFLMMRHFLAAGPPQATAESIVTQTARQVAQSNQLAGIAGISRQWHSEPLRPMSRDPFANLSQAKIVATPDNEPAEPAPPTFTEADGAFWTQLERTLDVREERARRIRTTRNEVMAAAAGLKIQSIVAGADERALVAGRVVRAGDRIEMADGVVFHVESVQSTQLIVSSAGFRVAVGMTGVPRVLAPGGP